MCSVELPPDVLEKIFELLSPSQIPGVALVCRTWYQATQHSKYWSSKKLIINLSNYQEVLRSERLKLMENVAVMDNSFYKEPKAAEEIVRFFVNNRDFIKLQSLELNADFPYDFDGEVLATLASSLKSFTDYSDLEGDVIKPILERVGRAESRTEQLAIHVRYVSDWNEENGFPMRLYCISIASLTGLREVTLRNNLLSPCQIRFLFEQIPEMAAVNLKKIDLSCSILKTVVPDTLARSVCRLETVIFRSCVLYSYQIHAIARKILEDEDEDWFCLKHLDLAENNFNCDTRLLATALSRIEGAHIKEFYPEPPSQSQLSRDLFNAINEDSKLRELELSDVPLRSFTAKLEKIHFNEASFYPGVLKTVLGNNCKLKTLEIQDCNGFDSVILTEAFFQLDHLLIQSTMGAVSQRQTRKIFETENSFKSVGIYYINLDHIDPRTMASFVCSGIEKIDFAYCNLSGGHVRAVLQEIVERHQVESALNLQSLELSYRGRALERDLTDRVASLLKLKISWTELTGDPEKLKGEGNVAYKAGKYELALKRFSDAIELTDSKEDRALFLRNRSATHFKMENFAAAIQDSTAALELTPNDPTALIRRALAYEKTNQNDLAIKDMKLASNLDPNNAIIKTILLRLQK